MFESLSPRTSSTPAPLQDPARLRGARHALSTLADRVHPVAGAAWLGVLAATLLGTGCGDGDGAAGSRTATGAGGTSGSTIPVAGPWRGSLASPGGPLTFGLEFVEEAGGLRAVLVNGVERRQA